MAKTSGKTKIKIAPKKGGASSGTSQTMSLARKPGQWLRRLWMWLGVALLVFLCTSVGAVVAYKWLPVPVTPLMLYRCAQQAANGQEMRMEHEWVPIDSISHNVAQAVMASEDNLFLHHSGFDFEQIHRARLEALHGGRERGASTISQQTAKNVFLWQGHSWVRKGLEAYFTVLIELIWGKERIMEVYLNSIEMGQGIYGVQAVAQFHFGKTADRLTAADAALIAASLPNPLKRNSAAPTRYMKKRQRQIVSLMKKIDDCGMGCR